MILLKDLQEIGFSKNLATVYVALFSLGETTAGKISKHTDLHRHIVYTELEKLLQRKLIVKREKKKVAYYSALNPSRLLDDLQKKELKTKDIITNLHSMQIPHQQEITVYEGKEELRRKELEVYEKINPDEEIKYIGFSKHWGEVMGADLLDQFKKIHRRKKFKIKALSSIFTKTEEDYTAATGKDLTDIKVVPGVSNSNSEVQILKDRITIKTFAKPYSAIEIINPEVVKNYNDYFNYLWGQTVRTYTGWDQLEHLFWKEAKTWMKEGETEYAIAAGYGTGGDRKRILDFFVKYNESRVKKGLKKKLLFFEKDREFAKKEALEAGDKDLSLTELRFVPDEFYSPMAVQHGGNKVIVVLFSENPSATLYEDPDVVAAFKKQFDLLWSIGKE